MSATNRWTPKSWRDFPISQQPTYTDEALLQQTEQLLSTYPPLVFAGEVNRLKSKLADITEQKAFLLQGGDCAETFKDFNANNIRDTLKVILQMAVVITFGGGKPVVKVGRMAGQFAKPRSADTETIDGVTLPSFRGDMVNDIAFTQEGRLPNPDNMTKCYNQSAATLNLLRSFTQGGFADLHQLHAWNLDFIDNLPIAQKYGALASSIQQALSFIDACGIHSSNTPELTQTDFYVSHEALILNYEEALTRQSSLDDKYYDCSGHLLWIGERTRSLDEAHIEFFRGIENPIGVKISQKIAPDELLRLIDTLNPNNERGKLTLITRMGSENMKAQFPALLKAVQKEGKHIIWSSDPMHGNTFKSSSGYKTRSLQDIIAELKTFFEIHQAENSYAGGVHLEMTGSNVTECIGGLNEVTEGDLAKFYETACDPRLNCDQALELAFYIADVLKEM